jgi:hypothetical protein
MEVTMCIARLGKDRSTTYAHANPSCEKRGGGFETLACLTLSFEEAVDQNAMLELSRYMTDPKLGFGDPLGEILTMPWKRPFDGLRETVLVSITEKDNGKFQVLWDQSVKGAVYTGRPTFNRRFRRTLRNRGEGAGFRSILGKWLIESWLASTGKK